MSATMPTIPTPSNSSSRMVQARADWAGSVGTASSISLMWPLIMSSADEMPAGAMRLPPSAASAGGGAA